MAMSLWSIESQNESAAMLTTRGMAICEYKYDEVIEDASEILVDAMLGRRHWTISRLVRRSTRNSGSAMPPLFLGRE